MPVTLNLIEQVRARTEKQTDYAVAKALEMSQSNLARVLCGKGTLGEKAAVRVSEILQRDLLDILAMIREETAKSESEKRFWERRSPRISATVAIAFMAIVAGVGLIGSHPANATSLYKHTVLVIPIYTLCALGLLTFIKKYESALASKKRQLKLFKLGARQAQSRLSLHHTRKKNSRQKAALISSYA